MVFSRAFEAPRYSGCALRFANFQSLPCLTTHPTETRPSESPPVAQQKADFSILFGSILARKLGKMRGKGVPAVPFPVPHHWTNGRLGHRQRLRLAA